MIKVEYIERVTVVYPVARKLEALGFCAAHGYTPTRSGPLPIDTFQFDHTQFHVVAEKEIDSERVLCTMCGVSVDECLCHKEYTPD